MRVGLSPEILVEQFNIDAYENNKENYQKGV